MSGNVPPNLSPGDGSDVHAFQNPDGSVGARFDALGRRRATTQVTAPAKTAGAGAGTSPTITLAGSDEHGVLTVVAGSSPAAGTMATITFNQAYATTPAVVLVSAADAATALLNPYGSATTTVLTLGLATLPTQSATYKIHYTVVGGK